MISFYWVSPHVGWLTDLTDWIRDLVESVMGQLMAYFTDLFQLWFAAAIDTALLILNAVPFPDFLSGVSICGILSGGGPIVGWAISTMQVPAGVALIAAGFAFRMGRKVFTVFQW